MTNSDGPSIKVNLTQHTRSDARINKDLKEAKMYQSASNNQKMDFLSIKRTNLSSIKEN